MKTKLYESDGTPRAVAIVGPTASGKTDFSLCAAERFFGEIVGCDSMQIYRRMDIGTAKPTAEERARAPHHMVDFLAPDAPYSAADYAQDARAAIDDVLSRGHLPILCGGTGLYLEAVRSGRHDELPPIDPAVREALEREAAACGAEAMHRLLAEVDPEAAEAIHPNNVRRTLRALEIFRATGKPKSEWDRESRERPPALSILTLALFPTDRKALHARIDRRVDRMMAEGLGREVADLYRDGLLAEGSTAAAAIGYKEYAAFLRGECTEAEAVEQIKIATHRYARRQLTWFRAIPGAIPLACDEGGVTPASRDAAYLAIEQFLNQ